MIYSQLWKKCLYLATVVAAFGLLQAYLRTSRKSGTCSATVTSDANTQTDDEWPANDNTFMNNGSAFANIHKIGDIKSLTCICTTNAGFINQF